MSTRKTPTNPMATNPRRDLLGSDLPGVGAAALALALGLVGCAGQASSEPPQQAQLGRALAPPSRLDPPEDLPEPARAVLRSRMASHAQDMGALMSAIMVLDYETIHDRALAIASDVNFARPLTGDATELNSLLPARFFDLQDEMKARARELAAAAAEQSAMRVAEAYGAASETCVSCHATYRAGRQP